ncbi:hypothetical protein GCM10022225_51290 [Plantactinospora mayteni]|uniref:NACHT domain-containing protein n=1 Tax=Plantactinospora mayteni TaxID=566021 RepID=A0ABQ4F462_9ACTN|nr:serine protease [Plantactinospora mayteni]GIH01692.1 hypothetical protein Pma05_82640 [Plantactinospora mayteni]
MIDPARVAEIIVTTAAGGRRGSGYRISDTEVLTAAHVVGGGSRILVRFDADTDHEWTREAAVVLTAGGDDVAILRIDAGGGIRRSEFAGIPAADAMVSCSTVGFPRWKIRDDASRRLLDGSPSQYRDTCHLTATVALLANRREATLELAIATPPAPDPDPGRSPWEGMSGAAVFHDGRIVGIVTRHHRGDGLGRLAAGRADGWTDPQLRGLMGPLTQAVLSAGGALALAAQLSWLRSIAPPTLEDRSDELAELMRFCGGDEPYLLWQGPPWSGKTALLSWFALHPPAGTRIVSFFVTSRLSGESDSDAFLASSIEQLAAIAGEEPLFPAQRSARVGHYLRLLETAGRAMPLTLVIDGLDEDTGRRPSIASLLPREVPAGVQIVVAGRESPGLPADVAAGHPLRRCRTVRLSQPRLAQDLEAAAKSELIRQLESGIEGQRIVGLVTASGGSLTVTDLADLAESPRWAVEELLGSVLGRSFTFVSQIGEDPVCAFAHATLQEIAERMLGPSVNQLRATVLDAAADRYRAAGWPDDTPDYLLRSYGRLLLRYADPQRLAEFAGDPARHDLMLRRTRSDYAATIEVTAAVDLLAEAGLLAGLAAVAAERDRIVHRGTSVPVDLPAVLARLGEPDLGESLARAVGNEVMRAYAITELAAAVPARAQALLTTALGVTRSIAGDRDRFEALATIATHPAVRDDPGQTAAILAEAVGLARESGSTELAGRCAVLLAKAGRATEAQEVAASLGSAWAQAEVLATIAVYLTGDERVRLAGTAERIAMSLTDDAERVSALAAVAQAWSGADIGEAARVAEACAEIAESHPYLTRADYARPREWRVTAKYKTSLAMTYAHNFGSGLRWAQDLFVDRVKKAVADEERLHVDAMETLVRTMISQGLADEAVQTAGEAFDEGRGYIFSNVDPESISETMAIALAEAGDTGLAEQAARALADPFRRASALAATAAAHLDRERPQDARRLAAEALTIVQETEVTDGHVLLSLLEALCAAEPAWVRLQCRELARRPGASAFVDRIAAVQVAAGAYADAAKIVWSIPDRWERHLAVEAAVWHLAEAGRFKQATQMARRLKAKAEAENLRGAWFFASNFLDAWNGMKAAIKHRDAAEAMRVTTVALATTSSGIDSPSPGAITVWIRLLAQSKLLGHAAWIGPTLSAFSTDRAARLAIVTDVLMDTDPATGLRVADEAIGAARSQGSAPALATIAKALAPHAPGRARELVAEALSMADDDHIRYDCALALGHGGQPQDADDMAAAITQADLSALARGRIAAWAAKDARTHATATWIAVNLLAGEHWPMALEALAALHPEAAIALYTSLLR